MNTSVSSRQQLLQLAISLFCFLSYYPNSLYSQNDQNSLEALIQCTTYNNYSGDFYKESHFDLSNAYAMLDTADLKNRLAVLKPLMFSAYYVSQEAYATEAEEAKKLLDNRNLMIENGIPVEDIAELHYLYGIHLGRIQEYDSAIQHLHKADKTYDRNDPRVNLVRSYINSYMAWSHSKRGMQQGIKGVDSVSHFRALSYELAKRPIQQPEIQSGYYGNILSACSNYGVNLRYDGYAVDAIRVLEEGVELANKQEFIDNIPTNYYLHYKIRLASTIGTSYSKLGDYQNADLHIDNAIQLVDLTPDPCNYGFNGTRKNKGLNCLWAGRYQEGIDILKEAEPSGCNDKATATWNLVSLRKPNLI